MVKLRALALVLPLAAAAAFGWLLLQYKVPPATLLTHVSLAEVARTFAVWLVLGALAMRFARPFKRACGDAMLRDDASHPGRLLCGIMLVVAAGYVALALTPSHYAIGLDQLGAPQSPLLLEPRAVRSDEFAILTPLFQTAVRGGYSLYNQFSPYHESLKGFWALPIADWSLVFKPQLWGFWAVPPAYAYSFYFAVLWVSFLTGYTLLLTQLGAEVRIAALGSVCLLFSGLVQVWWTTNAPAFALAPWPFVVFLLPLRAWIKLPLLFWTLSVWVFGFVYPPFIISGGFALGVLILAFRRDAFTWANLAIGTGAAIAFGICFILYFGELIHIMQATVYPGSRLSSGGGTEWSKLTAHVLPFFQTANLIPLYNADPCAIQVVSTMLPLTLLCLVDYTSLRNVLRRDAMAWSIVAAGLVLTLAWMYLPVPAALGRMLLWTYVPPYRMVWGSGLLLTLAVTLLASRSRFELSNARVSLLAGIMVASWLVSKIGYTRLWKTTDMPTAMALVYGTHEWFAAIAILGTGWLAMKYKAPGMAINRAFLAAAAVVGLFTFGTFNPVQQAYPIFDIPQTPFLENARREAEQSPNGWAVLPRAGGSLMSGAGIPAINHVMVAPQLAFFRTFFPGMSDDAFNTIFNRYAYIIPFETINEPRLAQDDMIFIPAAVVRARPASRAVEGR